MLRYELEVLHSAYFTFRIFDKVEENLIRKKFSYLATVISCYQKCGDRKERLLDETHSIYWQRI